MIIYVTSYCTDIPLVKMTGSDSDSEGLVNIYYAGKWGHICGAQWDSNAATVLCRMLGYRYLYAGKWIHTCAAQDAVLC